MDCFAEPVIGRAFARPVGSQRRGWGPSANTILRHCEELLRRSNPYFLCGGMDCFAALAMTGRERTQISDSYRSFHSGFSPSIKANFFAPLPALICFSRVMASIMVSCNSYQTQTLHPYLADKPFTSPSRCSKARRGRLAVTPV